MEGAGDTKRSQILCVPVLTGLNVRLELKGKEPEYTLTLPYPVALFFTVSFTTCHLLPSYLGVWVSLPHRI